MTLYACFFCSLFLLTFSAKRIITEFNKERYIRIGSSKETFRKYPEREIDLAVILRNGLPTIINTASRNQNLTFTELKSYYVAKDAFINPNNFEENLSLYVPGSKKYNELAFILSNENDITCRISIFNGKRKSDTQYALNDFGKKCILITIDQIMAYIESFNITKMDEENRLLERNDIHLFDSDCLREALSNAFIHNDWVDLNAPMISIFEDRIEILSYGGLPNRQTKIGFLSGKSKPRCNELAEIFLQLRISERSGRGVTKIYDKYGENVFNINDDFIKVTIPFSFERKFGTEHVVKLRKTPNSHNNRKKKSDKAKLTIIQEMKKNPKITTEDLIDATGLGKTSIQTYIRKLSENNVIERIGGKKGGYWKINDENKNYLIENDDKTKKDA